MYRNYIDIPHTSGFFGNVPGSLLSTVGRGYTDLCAALIAVGLAAEELQIWKEVDGIFTADPRKVPGARLLPIITPEEAAELTYYGSEVIHPFTMEQVIRARIPIRIKNVENPGGRGTIIFPDSISRNGIATPPHPPKVLLENGYHLDLSRKHPTAVTVKDNVVVLNIHSNRKSVSHGFLAQIFGTLDKYGIVIDLISTSEVHISMAFGADLGEREMEKVLDELKKLGTVRYLIVSCFVWKVLPVISISAYYTLLVPCAFLIHVHFTRLTFSATWLSSVWSASK